MNKANSVEVQRSHQSLLSLQEDVWGWLNWWVSIPHPVLLQVNHPGKSGVSLSVWVFPAWVQVLHICENASNPRRTQRTQLRFCTTPDSTISFATQPFPLHCFVSFSQSLWMQSLWFTCSALLFFSFNLNSVWPLWKGRYANKEWQKIPLSPIFLLFQATLGQADDVWVNACENQHGNTQLRL